MPPDIGGFMDGVFLFTIVTVVASLAIPLVIVGVVIWAIRRRRDPAEESLRVRLAPGVDYNRLTHSSTNRRARAPPNPGAACAGT
jgi:hypothetical protein